MSLGPFILLIIGLVLVLAELIVPGAIMGIIGASFLIASLIVFVQEGHSLLADISFFCFVVFSVIFLIWFALRRIRLSKAGLYAHGDQEGFTASSFDAALIGKEGIAATDLKPGGFIDIDGDQHQALSQSGYIVRGKTVRVISGEAESLTVVEKE